LATEKVPLKLPQIVHCLKLSVVVAAAAFC